MIKQILKVILFFFGFFIIHSCSETGDKYYANENGEEGIFINLDTSKFFLLISAQGLDNNLTITVSYKLIDTAKWFSNFLEKIKFSINNLRSENADNQYLFFIADKIKFKDIDSIPDFFSKVRSGTSLDFIYEFNDSKVENLDMISIDLQIHIKEDGKDKFFFKKLSLYKHNRHKTWFTYH